MNVVKQLSAKDPLTIAIFAFRTLLSGHVHLSTENCFLELDKRNR